MHRRTWLGRALVLALGLGAAVPCAADVIETPEHTPPGYRVRLVDRDALAGRTLVAVGAGITYQHGDREPQTSYTILDEFAVQSPRRICAVPTDMVQASPVGALGPRMLRGARAASGAITEGQDAVREVEALFDRDEVACAPLGLPAIDRPDVEAVEEAYRATSVEGRALTLVLVEVGYQIHGQTTTLAAGPGGARPPPPPVHGSCGCRAGRGAASPVALAAWLALALVLVSHRAAARGARAPRRPDPARG